MNGISCQEDLITSRYDYLKKHMTPDSHLSIFNIESWSEPWGFGRDNVAEANKLYKEAMTCLGYVDDPDECNTISGDSCSGCIFITLKSKDQFGIVYVVYCDQELPEYIEDLFNHVAAQVPKERVPVELKQAPEVKKPDNLVINRMTLFSGNLPL